MKNKKWERYEEIAAYLLNEFAEKFGIERVEGKQLIKGNKSGTEWQIDAKGIRDKDNIFLIIECRRYKTSKQKQENLAALAYRIDDTGAAGGIIVSPLGLQEGAEKIANAENIHNVILDENSTTTDYMMKFLNEIFIGIGEKITLRGSISLTKIDKNGNAIEILAFDET